MNKSDINKRTKKYCENNPLNEPKLKNWLMLSEVLKQYKTSYTEIIKLTSIKILQVTVIGDDIWFNRGNLDINLNKK